MATTTRSIRYNAIENAIEISPAFAKKAQKYGTPEYCALRDAMKQNEGATVRETRLTAEAGTKSNLTTKVMRTRIELLKEMGQQDLTAQFETIVKYAKTTTHPYQFVKTWFEKNVPEMNVETGVVETKNSNIVELPVKKEVKSEEVSVKVEENMAKAE